MKMHIFSYTKNGAAICSALTKYFSAKQGFDASGYAKEKYCAQGLLHPIEGLREDFLESAFGQSGAIVFIGAIGIAVRKIAPFVRDKTSDPAVISIDEQGMYVIPLLSGHIGGANALSQEIAALLKSVPVITTATDLQNKFAIDSWASQNDMTIVNPENIKYISSDILEGVAVGLDSDFPIKDEPPCGIENRLDTVSGVCITLYNNKTPFERTLILSPKCVVVGMGCQRGISLESCETLLLAALDKARISVQAVFALASIDLKSDEPALLQLCEKYSLRFVACSSSELKGVSGRFSGSEFVEKVTGVDNVCERAAVFASGNGKLILAKQTRDGATIALAQKDCAAICFSDKNRDKLM